MVSHGTGTVCLFSDLGLRRGYALVATRAGKTRHSSLPTMLPARRGGGPADFLWCASRGHCFLCHTDMASRDDRLLVDSVIDAVGAVEVHGGGRKAAARRMALRDHSGRDVPP